jgi:hypothetical protein
VFKSTRRASPSFVPTMRISDRATSDSVTSSTLVPAGSSSTRSATGSVQPP